jgi:hypothetical protein
MKCCYYEKDGQEKYICTTDTDCPDLTGWTLIGSWSVDDCVNCFGSGEVGSGETDEEEFVRPGLRAGETFLDELEGAIAISHWIKEHWDVVFPHGPKPPVDFVRDFRERPKPR